MFTTPGAAAAIGVPQFMQKESPTPMGAPQEGQVAPAGCAATNMGAAPETAAAGAPAAGTATPGTASTG